MSAHVTALIGKTCKACPATTASTRIQAHPGMYIETVSRTACTEKYTSVYINGVACLRPVWLHRDPAEGMCLMQHQLQPGRAGAGDRFIKSSLHVAFLVTLCQVEAPQACTVYQKTFPFVYPSCPTLVVRPMRELNLGSFSSKEIA